MSWPGFRTWSGKSIIDSHQSWKTTPLAGDVILKCPWKASGPQKLIQYFQGPDLAHHERCWSHAALVVGQGEVIDSQFDRTPKVKKQSLLDFLGEDQESHYRFRRHINPFQPHQQQEMSRVAEEISANQSSYNLAAVFGPIARAKGAKAFTVDPNTVDCSELAAYILFVAARVYPFTEGASLAPSPAAFAISKRFADYSILHGS